MTTIVSYVIQSILNSNQLDLLFSKIQDFYCWGENMDVENIQERLIRLLRLRTTPVAVTLMKNKEDIPAGIERPKIRLTICQMVALSRIHERVLAGGMDEIICSYAQSVLGFADWPEDMISGERRAGTRVEDVTASSNLIENIPKIETDSFEAIVTAPLAKTPFKPDLILLFANPAQMTRLIHAATWKTGERLSFTTAAEAGTCAEGIAATYLRNDVNIAFPCYGTRRFGMAADSELIFGIPIEKIDEIMDGLEKTHAVGSTYPICLELECTPKPPSLYAIMRERPPK
jgi:uncharacterized protein (DUF169 family)